MSLKLITKGSKSFHLASTFFPPAFRQVSASGTLVNPR